MALDRIELKTLALEIAAVLPPAERHEDVQDANGLLPTLIQSPRARAVRRIAEIATLRGWQMEVVRALDKQEASYVDDLTDAAVFALRDRMEHFEDCVQHACDPDDSPPAR